MQHVVHHASASPTAARMVTHYCRVVQLCVITNLWMICHCPLCNPFGMSVQQYQRNSGFYFFSKQPKIFSQLLFFLGGGDFLLGQFSVPIRAWVRWGGGLALGDGVRWGRTWILSLFKIHLVGASVALHMVPWKGSILEYIICSQ